MPGERTSKVNSEGPFAHGTKKKDGHRDGKKALSARVNAGDRGKPLGTGAKAESRDMPGWGENTAGEAAG